MTGGERRFLPRVAPIDAYGTGGFRFAEMSHRGSLLCLPSGMHAWPVTSAAELSAKAFEPVFAEADAIEILLVGTGPDVVFFPEALRWRFRDLKIVVDAMPTGAATRTWNVLLAEDRRVAAALIAVP
ncbi:Mth938-like domain-containing protein [Labrys portucalensis]|uniref:MTH938/NDUFAF3 family protein n=1 Tax=Labrys neptuniae TaxID=376174 RepID=A0ABV6Z9P3_9HYPH|nr:MTH938/NDUFAF3 family protein [Labrys neptuniae]MDT3378047.1 MTH938/NDUFAF3 family protein [Labrys neptuniae]